jgi:hypothetical protein
VPLNPQFNKYIGLSGTTGVSWGSDYDCHILITPRPTPAWDRLCNSIANTPGSSDYLHVMSNGFARVLNCWSLEAFGRTS